MMHAERESTVVVMVTGVIVIVAAAVKSVVAALVGVEVLLVVLAEAARPNSTPHRCIVLSHCYFCFATSRRTHGGNASEHTLPPQSSNITYTR